MEYRQLGTTGIKISIVSLGNSFKSDDLEEFETMVNNLKKAKEIGINYFDASGYPNTQNLHNHESQFINALKKSNIPRNQFILAKRLYWGCKSGDASDKKKIPKQNSLSRKLII